MSVVTDNIVPWLIGRSCSSYVMYLTAFGQAERVVHPDSYQRNRLFEFQ